jgi:hypothetical protein
MSNQGYLVFQNNLLTENVTVSSIDKQGDFIASNLLLPKLRPGWRWEPQNDIYLDLDGSTEYAWHADDPDFDITGDMTVEFEHTTGSDITTSQMIMTKWAGAGNRSYQVVLASSRYRLVLSQDGTATAATVRVEQVLTTNTKYKVKICYKATTQTVSAWVEEKSVAVNVIAGAVPNSIFNSAAQFQLGAFSGVVNLLGRVHFAAIASGLYTDGNPLDPTICAGYWDFQNSDLTDSSPNGHTLTGVNISAADFIDSGEVIPAILRFDFQIAQLKNWFGIDRTHNLLTGDTIDIYFSNVSSAVGDSAESYSITLLETQEENPIILALDTSTTKYRYARVEIRNEQTTKLSFNEINWITIGSKESLSKDYEVNHSISDSSEVVINQDFIGDGRFQRRSEPYRTYTGRIRALPESERLDILLRLARYASNGWPFFFCYANETTARELEHTRLVKWTNAAVNQDALVRPYIRDPQGNLPALKEVWDLRFNLKEVGTIAIPYILPPYAEETETWSGIGGPLLVLDTNPVTGCGTLSNSDFQSLVSGVTGTPAEEQFSFQFTVKPSAAQVAAAATFVIAFQFPDIGALPTGTKFRVSMEWTGTGFLPRLVAQANQLDMGSTYETTTEEVTYKMIYDFNLPVASHMNIWAVDHPVGNSDALSLGETIGATGFSKTTNGYFIIGGDYDDGKTAPIDPDDFINKMDADTVMKDIYYADTWLNDAVSMTTSNALYYWSLKVNPVTSTGVTGGTTLVTPNCVKPNFIA